MKQLREFLNRQIEVFLNYEFGPGMQNMTPSGIRPIRWEPEHTARLVHHLAGNWEMVEEALRVRQEKGKTDTALHGDGQWTPMDERYAADPGEVAAPELEDAISRLETDERNRRAAQRCPGEAAADNAQADAAAAEYDATPEGERPPVNPEVTW